VIKLSKNVHIEIFYYIDLMKLVILTCSNVVVEKALSLQVEYPKVKKMIILSIIKDFTFPLQNPVLIFSLLLFIILFAPLILNKFKIPHLIGLILAGVVIGPNGMNLMLRDSSIVLYGTVGLLYIMFLAGVEINLTEFRKNIWRSIVFGLYTFIIPMGLGTVAGYYLLDFPLVSSILLASLFASHTLITYPIVSKLGLLRNKAVNVAVGGTIITDTLALMVLAVIVSMSTGEVNQEFWIRFGISFGVFTVIVFFIFPLIARWFFKKVGDNVSQYIFVLGLVFLGAFLAEAAGVEAIIGAFLAGLSLNRLIPSTSPLMNRIEFVGNALFIPIFLIGVGMLIDVRIFFTDLNTIFVALVMTTVATFSKLAAAWMTQQTFRFSADERKVIFGLSNAQAAATLAAVLVGYNVIIGYEANGEPIRLLGESVLNGSILMILVTCTIASFSTQKGAQKIVAREESEPEIAESDDDERILIPFANGEVVEETVSFGLSLKFSKNKNALYTMHVIDNTEVDPIAEKSANKFLTKAKEIAASTDNNLTTMVRYDLNFVNSLTGVVREFKITDVLIGISLTKELSQNFLSNLNSGVLRNTNVTTLVYKPVQPLGTIKRNIVIVPELAEKEIGFPFWLIKIWNIARNTGAKTSFYSSVKTLNSIREINAKHPIDAAFHVFEDWDDFLIIARDIRFDDNIFVVLSRKDYPSYQNNMSRVPLYLNKYFKDNSFVLIYPLQKIGQDTAMGLHNASVHDPSRNNLDVIDEIGKNVLKLFKRK